MATTVSTSFYFGSRAFPAFYFSREVQGGDTKPLAEVIVDAPLWQSFVSAWCECNYIQYASVTRLGLDSHPVEDG